MAVTRNLSFYLFFLKDEFHYESLALGT